MSPLLVTMLALAAPDLARGKALFAERCAVCHGETGAGDGTVAASLSPPPADFTRARFSTDRLLHVLREGVPGTAMPAQPGLAPADRAALIAWVQSLGPKAAPPKAPAPVLALGENVFSIRCSACHGTFADGSGPSASRVGRPPTDFTRKQPTKERIVDVLTHGIRGTAMTPMRRLLSDAELDGVVAYLQSVYGRNVATGAAAESGP
ncbi:MAG: c-type cytochrome [Myxococcaceae bacterium]|nr:c-type cytochrome [Myxococcaceae bacterium]